MDKKIKRTARKVRLRSGLSLRLSILCLAALIGLAWFGTRALSTNSKDSQAALVKVATDAMTRNGYGRFLKGGGYNLSTRAPYLKELKVDRAWPRAQRESGAWLTAWLAGTPCPEDHAWQHDYAVVTIPLETRAAPANNVNVYLARNRATGAWQGDLYFANHGVVTESVLGTYIMLGDTSFQASAPLGR